MEANNKKNLIQICKFVCFSISAGVIQIVSDTLLFEVCKLSASLSYFIALTLSVLWNFTLNRKFTFKSANNVAIAMLKVVGYYLVFTPLSTWWTKILVEDLSWNNYLVLFMTMAINMLTEFLFQKFFVFNEKIKKEN